MHSQPFTHCGWLSYGGEPEQPSRDVVAVMAPTGVDGGPPRWSVGFWVGDVDVAAARASELGVSVVAPPYDIPDAPMRQGPLADPQGAAFSVTKVSVR